MRGKPTLPACGCEQGEDQRLVDPGRNQALGPGREFLGRVGQVRGAQRRTGPVGAGDLDVPRIHRTGEEVHGRDVQVDARQGVVAVAQRVGERQPGTVERDDPAEDLEQGLRALGRGAGRGSGLGQQQFTVLVRAHVSPSGAGRSGRFRPRPNRLLDRPGKDTNQVGSTAGRGGLPRVP